MQTAFDILKSGVHDFDTWLSEFSGKFSGELKDKFQFTQDKEEVFYLCTWATKYVYKGCSLSIGDWASRMTPAFIESLDALTPHNETMSTCITPIPEEVFNNIMLVLVTYDVETVSPQGQHRLQQVAKVCQNYGQRVQNSVFECVVDYSQYTKLKLELKGIMDESHDTIRLYNLGNNYSAKVETLGIKHGINVEEELVI
jgi:CRISPR-associated protein Cas2